MYHQQNAVLLLQKGQKKNIIRNVKTVPFFIAEPIPCYVRTKKLTFPNKPVLTSSLPLRDYFAAVELEMQTFLFTI
jgi:hypothetical protein